MPKARQKTRYGYHGTRASWPELERGLLPQRTFVHSHGGWVTATWFTNDKGVASSHGAVLRFPWPADAEFTPDSDAWLTFQPVCAKNIEVYTSRGLRAQWKPLCAWREW